MMAFMFPKDSQFVSLMVNKENDFGYSIFKEFFHEFATKVALKTMELQ